MSEYEEKLDYCQRCNQNRLIRYYAEKRLWLCVARCWKRRHVLSRAER